MNKNKILIYYCAFIIYVFLPNVYAEDKIAIPDISGEWVNLSANGEDTGAVFSFLQDGKYLDGKFTDTRDGEIIIEAPATGYIDINGNVIFDIYFGRITSTNRLKLSPDKNTLNGTYSNTVGNNGEVHIRKK